MQNAGAIASLYGFDILGFVLMNPETGEMESIADENSAYFRALDFLFEANRLGLAETVTLVQEERSKHFHIWIFPNQEWMQEKFGYGLQYLREINAYARENASDEDVIRVIKVAEEIKEYMQKYAKMGL